MLPKKGKKLPAWKGALAGRQAYADVMADLMKKEHGDSHRAVKLLMRQTDASERTIKHWLAAQHGPDTVFFLRLVATSPVIRAFVLGVIESPVIARQSSRPMRWDVAPLTPDAATANSMPQRPAGNDPINDPDHDPINGPMTEGLNERQRWFLNRVGKGDRPKAWDIMAHWQVSPKTARRDIRGLQSAGLLRFEGARRNGRYRLVQ